MGEARISSQNTIPSLANIKKKIDDIFIQIGVLNETSKQKALSYVQTVQNCLQQNTELNDPINTNCDAETISIDSPERKRLMLNEKRKSFILNNKTSRHKTVLSKYNCPKVLKFKCRKYCLSPSQMQYYRCTTCNEDCTSRTRMINKRKFRCPHCPATFNHSLSLQSHIHKHKKNEVESINCMPATKKPSVLKRKQQDHNLKDSNCSLDGKFMCEKCGKRYIKKRSLTQHYRFHSDTYELCKYCDYKTNFKTNMKRHTKLHFNIDTKFVCDYCGNGFTNKVNLLDHISYNHTTMEKQFKCEQCDKSFKRKSELVRHASSHSNIRPHACDICGIAFKRVSHLKRHQLSIHSLNKTKRLQRLRTDETGALLPIDKNTNRKKKQTKSGSDKIVDNAVDLQSVGYMVITVPSVVNVLQTTPTTVCDNSTLDANISNLISLNKVLNFNFLDSTSINEQYLNMNQDSVQVNSNNEKSFQYLPNTALDLSDTNTACS